MSSPKIAKIIADPIHKYVSVYEHELPILDSKYVQRLRNVRQNGNAYLTYPSAQATRFEHSLGTMELAGRMLSAALEKTENTVRKDFLDECGRALKVKASDEIASVLISTVRLAGLLHDIGHSAFSHTLEELLDAYKELLLNSEELLAWQKYDIQCGGRFSDFLGLRILEKDQELKAALGKYYAPVKDILGARRDAGGVFRTLHDLVSCDVDADRADYLARDGYTSGADFGVFDIERLIDSLRIQKLSHIVRGQAEYYFLIRPTIKALNAVEGLLIERYKEYKWLSYHHYVVTTNAILLEVVRRLLRAKLEDKKPFSAIDIQIIPVSLASRGAQFDNALQVFADDFDIIHAIRQAYSMILEGLATNQFGNYDQDYFVDFRYLIEEILLRKKRGLSVWKDSQGYADFDSMVASKIIDIFIREQENAHISRTGLPFTVEERKEVMYKISGETDIVLNWLSDTKLKRVFGQLKELEALVSDRLRTSNNLFRGIVLSASFFKPMESRSEDEYRVIGKDGQPVTVSDASELLERLKQTRRRDLRLHAYLLLAKETKVIETQEREELTKQAKDIMADTLLKWFEGKSKEFD